jgi:predicted 2-oxoglutarate/Fe(II)-dependent dioxygenase YbiX
MVIFPSFHQHKVESVTDGVRYSLVAWAYGDPFY